MLLAKIFISWRFCRSLRVWGTKLRNLDWHKLSTYLPKLSCLHYDLLKSVWPCPSAYQWLLGVDLLPKMETLMPGTLRTATCARRYPLSVNWRQKALSALTASPLAGPDSFWQQRMSIRDTTGTSTCRCYGTEVFSSWTQIWHLRLCTRDSSLLRAGLWCWRSQ